MMRTISLVVIALGVIGVVTGLAFIGLGAWNNADIKEAMRVEHVTLGIENADKTGSVIDSLWEAKKAADTVREHRHKLAPSYQDLLGKDKFDPTNPKHATYAQAINLENYLYLGTTALGLTLAIMGTGAFMMLAGLAISLLGLALYKRHDL